MPMSGGAVASACCCGACNKNCCTWWECAPASTATLNLAAAKIVTYDFSSGDVITSLEESWSISCTITRSGDSCANYRLSATSCTFDYQKIERTFWSGKRFTKYLNRYRVYEGAGEVDCGEPPAHDPDCHFNCNADGTCKDATYFRVAEVTETNYSCTIAGAASNPFFKTEHQALWVPGSVITIACSTDCGDGCARPILLFAPGTHSSVSSTRTFDIVDPCLCADAVANGNPCHVDSTPPPFVTDEFVILGRSGCLDSTSFDFPTTASSNAGYLLGYDNPTDAMLGVPEDSPDHFCFFINRSSSIKYCENPADAGAAGLQWCRIALDQCLPFEEIAFCYWPEWCYRQNTNIDWTGGI